MHIGGVVVSRDARNFFVLFVCIKITMSTRPQISLHRNVFRTDPLELVVENNSYQTGFVVNDFFNRKSYRMRYTHCFRITLHLIQLYIFEYVEVVSIQIKPFNQKKGK